MRTVRTILVASLLVGLLYAGTGSSPAAAAPTNQPVYGLTTTNQLVRFRSYDPGTILATRSITGLQANEKIVGIDFRPATGELYGLGSTSRLYVIDPSTGGATEHAVLSTPLTGAYFGIDFNPMIDRLRVVSNTDHNGRVAPDTGVVSADLALHYEPGKFGPSNPSVKAIAYTNSACGAPDPSRTTALYDIDSAEDLLAQQSTPNTGALTPVGGLGIDTRVRVGFDISPNNNLGYASIDPTNPTADQTSRLATVDLATGDLRSLGRIGPAAPALRILDIAIPFRSCLAL